MYDPVDPDRPDCPLYGLFTGVVTHRDDPLKIARVRVRIPGLIEESTGWALPLGTVGGGERGRGFFSVPEINSEVGVLFERGAVDSPYYLTGNWGRPGGQSDAPRATEGKSAAEVANVRAFETEEFELVFDDNAAEKKLLVRHKGSGAGVEVDGLTGSLSVTAAANLSITAVGQVEINGLVVTINGVPAGSGRL